MNTENTNDFLYTIKLEHDYAPKMVYSKSGNIAKWGEDNKLCNYYSDLYNYKGAGLHRAIIDKKVRMISGSGFIENDDNVDIIKEYNLEKISDLISKDLEVWGGFALEVVYNNDESINSIERLDLCNLRFEYTENGDLGRFIYSEKWGRFKSLDSDEREIEIFDGERKGSKCFYFFGDNLNTENPYPIPSYNNALYSIEIAQMLDIYDFNNIKNGYYPQFLINMYGAFSPPQKEKIAKDFKKSFAGVSGEKAIITFPLSKEEEVTISAIQLNNSDEMNKTLREVLPKNIAMGHGIPVQVVVPTEGSLSGHSERIELQREFYNDYINPRQYTISDFLSTIFEIELKLKSPFSDSDEEEIIKEKRSKILENYKDIIEIVKSEDYEIGKNYLEIFFGLDEEEIQKLYNK